MNTRIIQSLPLALKQNGTELKEQKALTQEYSDDKTDKTFHEPDNSKAVTVSINSTIEPVVRAMQGLGKQSQELIAILVRQLAKREGIDISTNALYGL